MKDFSFEISNQVAASNKLKMTSFPESISDLGQGTDNKYLHFTASVDLTNNKDKAVGQPQQVYLAFKKIDVR